MQCWICGNNANSGEHKIKKSLVAKTYGEYFENSKVLHLKNNRFSEIQGPNSKKIKYDQTICTNCNNSLSQPFDMAYDQFFDYVQNNPLSILEKRFVDFHEIYGNNYKQSQLDLFKYLVKLFGCDLVSVGHTVPSDLSVLFDKQHFKTALKISFSINEKKLYAEDPNHFGMGIDPLIVNQISRTNPKPIGYKWGMFFSFLQISFWYNFIPDGPYGAPWIADSRYVYLGIF
jgi:hypothetical protein